MKHWVRSVAIVGLFASTAATGCAQWSQKNDGTAVNSGSARAATAAPKTSPTKPGASSGNAVAAAKPDELRLYFDSGRASLRADSRPVLDQAARLFREGNPLVMIVTGQTDSAGDAEHNLSLSIQRADTVAKALVSRGIPASRLQVLGKGESEPLVHSADSVAVPENRVAIISWR